MDCAGWGAHGMRSAGGSGRPAARDCSIRAGEDRVGDAAADAPGGNRRAHARRGGQWICSLCGQRLPADSVQDARKRRHEERHTRYGRNNITAKPSQMSWRLAREE